MARSSLDASPGELIAGTAIITLGCATAVYIPVLGFACFFLLPLPALFYHVRFGGHAAFIVCALSLLIISLLSWGVHTDTLLMAGMLGHGLLIGNYVKHNASIEKTVAYPALIVLAGAFFIIVLKGNLSGAGAFGLVSDHIKQNLELTVALYKQVEASEDTIRMLEASVDRIHYALLAIFPAITAAALLIAAWINLLLGRIMLKAAGFQLSALRRLNVWQAPDLLVWGVIACGLFLLLPFQAPRIIALNILIVAMMVYLFQGFAIISFYFDKKKVPVFIRALIYGAVAIQQFLLLFVIGLGFFDTWLNLRRINAGGNDPSSS
ncbi:MAG: DUF2232 domain-containing protein [Desulfosalsimonadaceae bacterium]